MLLSITDSTIACDGGGDGYMPYGDGDGDGTGYGFNNGGDDCGGGGVYERAGLCAGYDGGGRGGGNYYDYGSGHGDGGTFCVANIVNASGEGPIIWSLIRTY